MKQLTYDEVFTYNHLLESFKKCLKGVKWKGTVQNYNNHLMTNLYLTYKSLKERKVKSGHFFRFSIMERGKTRDIQSVAINERVVQRCLCDYCLVPILSSKFIYDNSACIKDKGMHFALRRLKHHLHNFYLKYGTDGYILQFDLSKYFDSIPHQKLIDMVCKIIQDKDLQNLYAQLVNDFDGDKGIGLGSQISQISALYYPHEIDNKFTYDKEIFAYARYMDDGYLIARSKTKLVECLKTLNELCEKLDIKTNPKKTHIFKISSYMEYLKARIKMYSNGRIIVKPNRKNITRNRRKLKKLFKNKVHPKEIENIYQTTKGNFRFFNAHKTMINYQKLYNSLVYDL